MDYQELVQEIKQHNASERLALLEEISHSLRAEFHAVTTPAHPSTKAVYLGELDEQSKPVVLVRQENNGQNPAPKPLPMSNYAIQISPAGYFWGYGGAGPIALAHSLLNYQFDVTTADDYAWDFNDAIIKKLPLDQEHTPGPKWQLRSEELEKWLDNFLKARPAGKDNWKAEYADYLTEKYK